MGPSPNAAPPRVELEAGRRTHTGEGESSSSSSTAQRPERRPQTDGRVGPRSSATSPTRDTRKHKWQQQHRARSKRNNFHGG